MALKKVIFIFLFGIIAALAFVFHSLYSDLGKMGIDTDNTIIPPSETDKPDSVTGKGNDAKKQDSGSQEKKTQEEKKSFYTLIIGIDMRDGQAMFNTDSIIVAHLMLDEPEPAVKLVSLPRDTRVKNRYQQDVKINSIFSEGYMHALRESRKNPELLSGKKVDFGSFSVPEEYISSGMVQLRETVESFLDIDIDYMFLVNFNTVVTLVDAVGGIEVDVDRSMRYEAPSENTYIHLDEGRQVLNGEQALHFARFRLDSRGSAYDSNDFERGIRQQKVIMALVDKLASWNSLPKALNLIDIVTDNVKTDMSRSTMVSLVRQFYGKIDGEHIISVPFEGYWQPPFVLISEENLHQLKQNLHSTQLNIHTSDDPTSIHSS
jgi:LCP family protein required for cell wall assembly